MRARRIDTPPIRTEASRARSTVITPPSGSERDISERTLIYFGCSKQPFAENHDPDQLFLGSLHQEAIAALIDAVECNSGLSAFIAESGMGKTMLLHCLLECYSTAAHTAFLPRSCGGASGLKQALLQELERLLQRDGGSDRRVLIVLDEAHNLTSSELEVVRALSDVENHTSKLLHFMMAGRPALADMLLQPPLMDLKPRITVVNRDLRLTPGETERYINRRLSLSGYSGPPLFDREVIGEIAALTRGVPRQVNTICTKAMSRACGLEQKEITGSIIRDVTAVGPSFQVLPLPIKQIDRLDVDPLTHEEQRPARSL